MNTRVPRNLHSHEVVSALVMSGMGLQMPFGDYWQEDGLKDAIWRSVDRIRDSLARTCISVIVEDSAGEAWSC